MQDNTLVVQYNTGSKRKNGIYIQIFFDGDRNPHRSGSEIDDCK